MDKFFLNKLIFLCIVFQKRNQLQFNSDDFIDNNIIYTYIEIKIKQNKNKAIRNKLTNCWDVP